MRWHPLLVLESEQRSDQVSPQRHRLFFQIRVSNLQVGNQSALQALRQTFLAVR